LQPYRWKGQVGMALDLSLDRPRAPVRVDELSARAENTFYSFLKSCVDEKHREEALEFTCSEELYERYDVRLGEASREATGVLLVEWQDIVEVNNDLANLVHKHYYRVQPGISNAARRVLTEHFLDSNMPQDHFRRVEVAFGSFDDKFTVRELEASQIGQLTILKGQVTRTSLVRPELATAVFKCNDCGRHSSEVPQQFKFTEPRECSNAACSTGRGGKTEWTLQMDHPQTIFVDWQKLKVQEHANEIPSGSMPRTIDVIVRGSAVELAKPGDKVQLSGCLVTLPEVGKLMGNADRKEVKQQAQQSGERRQERDTAGDTGVAMRSLGSREMSYKYAFLAHAVLDGSGDKPVVAEKSAEEEDEADDDEEDAPIVPADVVHRTRAILDSANDKEGESTMDILSKCIAPNVRGHPDIKRGILLQLAGGVHKRTQDGVGMQIRGDINCCIVGDPSTAKSQFLKFVGRHVPRTIYTSGKSASASGLTASVMRDPDTGEFTIEAGALMLADKGICAIDEFEKMDSHDQVAIHEAMEQQTISIAKAGIKATLNARASVLAAANPIDGRYDTSRPLRANVAMTSPIMSRFDLFFIVTDDLNDEVDRELAEAICDMHMKEDQAIKTRLPHEDFLEYLNIARQFNPRMTQEAGDVLVTAFQRLRDNDRVNRNSSFAITTRQLESMIRLSEAVARLHLSDTVTPSHVEFAIRLMEYSLIPSGSGSRGRATINVGGDADDGGENADGAKVDATASTQADPTPPDPTPVQATQDPQDPNDPFAIPSSPPKVASSQAKGASSQAAGTVDKKKKVKKGGAVKRKKEGEGDKKRARCDVPQVGYAAIRRAVIELFNAKTQADTEPRVQRDLVQEIQNLTADNPNCEGCRQAKVLHNIIEHLITKESILVVVKDSATKANRTLNLADGLQED